MPEYLAALAVPPSAERLYRRVLRGERGALEHHAASLGWSRPAAADALEPLLDAGLVREEADGTLIAGDPRTAVGRLVEARRAALEREAAALDAAQDAIGQFAADHEAGAGGVRRPMWEIVPNDLAGGVAAQALARSQGPLLNSVVSVDWSPDGIEKSLARARACTRDGRPMRSLYPQEALADEQLREWMARFADAGEEQRIATTAISEFAVFGDEVVLAVAAWGDVGSDTVQITDPMLVAIFRTLFEHAWEVSLPLPTSQARADDTRLLHLLAAGYKDEAIARYLDVALRTVRRRVASLMADHGVDTRFQLGMAAQRAGLLDAEGSTPRRPH